MTYCLNTDLYRIAGITSSNLTNGDTDADAFIQAATMEVDRYTGTRWLFDANTDTTGTATAGAATTLTDSGKSWTSDEFADDYAVYIKAGTGSGQIRQITSNTATALTVATWDTNPDTDSEYEIFYSPIESETRDGNGTNEFFTRKHPLFNLYSLSIDSTSVTPSYVYQYNDSGRLVLSDDAEVQSFKDNTPQLISLTYFYGVRPSTRMKNLIRDFTASIAALMALTSQIGGTFDDVTSYQFPEFSASKGEPYTNIREAWLKTEQRMRTLRPLIPQYRHFAVA